MHHAWLQLDLRQSIEPPNTPFYAALTDAKLHIETTAITWHGLNAATRKWHLERCRRCQQILNRAIIDATQFDKTRERREADAVYAKYAVSIPIESEFTE